MSGAMNGLASAVSVVAVAWAGWEIGKWISEITGLNSVLENFFAKWIYGMDSVEEKMKEQDAKFQEFKKIRDEKIKTGILPAATQSIKIDPEISKAQAALDDFIWKKKYEQLSIAEKINAMEERRNQIAAEYVRTQDELKKIELFKEGMSAKFEIQDLQKQQTESTQNLQSQYDEKLERFKMSQMSVEEKINNLLTKRQILNDYLSSSKEEEIKKAMAILDLDEEITSLQSSMNSRTVLDNKPKFAEAVEKGTVEAYRAEIAGKNPTEEYNKKTANNTEKIYKGIQTTNNLLKPLNNLGVA